MIYTLILAWLACAAASVALMVHDWRRHLDLKLSDLVLFSVTSLMAAPIMFLMILLVVIWGRIARRMDGDRILLPQRKP